jgi:hypothetical protein
MSERHEWTEWHLTPRGWESGSNRIDPNNVTEKEIPVDRVISYRYREFMSSSFSKMDISLREVWNSQNKSVIKNFIQEFGSCPQRL